MPMHRHEVEVVIGFNELELPLRLRRDYKGAYQRAPLGKETDDDNRPSSKRWRDLLTGFEWNVDYFHDGTVSSMSPHEGD